MAKRRKKNIPLMIIGRFFQLVGLLLILTVTFLIGIMTIICYGPSEKAKNLFVTSVTETSAAKFLAKIYFTDEQIAEILEANSTVDLKEVTNEELIEIPTSEEIVQAEELPIEIIEIKGATYKGKLMIVRDPSRVVVATPDNYGDEGMKIEAMVQSENGIAGINAGGFVDTNGVGNGGTPSGIVIKNGEMRYGSLYAEYSVIGFDFENRLIVGTMSGQDAMDKNMRDAVSFGPALIINGKRAEVSGTSSGLNPRTCIGQRADGAVLLLVIDGRQANSVGATMEDCIEVMEEHGAINASNLDGGSSTIMYYEGEIINVCASIYGPRKLPTAFVVK